MSAGVPKMERIFHCSQGLIASLVWTHNSESLCFCGLTPGVNASNLRRRTHEFSHPSTFGRQALIVCSTAEFSLQNANFREKSRRNSQ